VQASTRSAGSRIGVVRYPAQQQRIRDALDRLGRRPEVEVTELHERRVRGEQGDGAVLVGTATSTPHVSPSFTTAPGSRGSSCRVSAACSSVRRVIEEFRFEALAVFHDLPVFAFPFREPDDVAQAGIPQDVEAWAWRVGVAEYEDTDAQEIFPLFLDSVDTTRIKALLLGAWYGDVSGEGVDKFHRALLDAADRFPALEALFVSDVPQELAEISWIEQEDPAALLAAFPRLRVLGVRGGLGKQIEPLVHAELEELVFQSGGMPAEAVRAVGGQQPARARQLGPVPRDLGVRRRRRRRGLGADPVRHGLSQAPPPRVARRGERRRTGRRTGPGSSGGPAGVPRPIARHPQ
jgi:hypothetical protein